MAGSGQKWLTLLGHALATFCNAVGFGIFFTQLDIFADYYDTSEDNIKNSFYIGLVGQMVFCVPALKLTEWRLDYSIICGAFLTTASYWFEYLAQENSIVGRLGGTQ